MKTPTIFFFSLANQTFFFGWSTENFVGWQVGIITSDPGLAKATELKFLNISNTVDNGGIKVQLYETKINHPQI